jgi:hypothetical protein
MPGLGKTSCINMHMECFVLFSIEKSKARSAFKKENDRVQAEYSRFGVGIKFPFDESDAKVLVEKKTEEYLGNHIVEYAVGRYVKSGRLRRAAESSNDKNPLFFDRKKIRKEFLRRPLISEKDKMRVMVLHILSIEIPYFDISIYRKAKDSEPFMFTANASKRGAKYLFK